MAGAGSLPGDAGSAIGSTFGGEDTTGLLSGGSVFDTGASAVPDLSSGDFFGAGSMLGGGGGPLDFMGAGGGFDPTGGLGGFGTGGDVLGGGTYGGLQDQAANLGGQNTDPTSQNYFAGGTAAGATPVQTQSYTQPQAQTPVPGASNFDPRTGGYLPPAGPTGFGGPNAGPPSLNAPPPGDAGSAIGQAYANDPQALANALTPSTPSWLSSAGQWLQQQGQIPGDAGTAIGQAYQNDPAALAGAFGLGGQPSAAGGPGPGDMTTIGPGAGAPQYTAGPAAPYQPPEAFASPAYPGGGAGMESGTQATTGGPLTRQPAVAGGTVPPSPADPGAPIYTGKEEEPTTGGTEQPVDTGGASVGGPAAPGEETTSPGEAAGAGAGQGGGQMPQMFNSLLGSIARMFGISPQQLMQNLPPQLQQQLQQFQQALGQGGGQQGGQGPAPGQTFRLPNGQIATYLGNGQYRGQNGQTGTLPGWNQGGGGGGPAAGEPAGEPPPGQGGRAPEQLGPSDAPIRSAPGDYTTADIARRLGLPVTAAPTAAPPSNVAAAGDPGSAIGQTFADTGLGGQRPPAATATAAPEERAPDVPATPELDRAIGRNAPAVAPQEPGGAGAAGSPPAAGMLAPQAWRGQATGRGTTAFSPQLRARRAQYAQQIAANPRLKAQILHIMHNEQGENPQGTQAIAESMLNRAALRGHSLTSRDISGWTYGRRDGGYYDARHGIRPMPPVGSRGYRILEQSLSNALAGGNLAGGATDNASGSFARGEIRTGTFQSRATYGKESFLSPGTAEPGYARRFPGWYASLITNNAQTAANE